MLKGKLYKMKNKIKASLLASFFVAGSCGITQVLAVKPEKDSTQQTLPDVTASAAAASAARFPDTQPAQPAVAYENYDVQISSLARKLNNAITIMQARRPKPTRNITLDELKSWLTYKVQSKDGTETTYKLIPFHDCPKHRALWATLAAEAPAHTGISRLDYDASIFERKISSMSDENNMDCLTFAIEANGRLIGFINVSHFLMNTGRGVINGIPELTFNIIRSSTGNGHCTNSGRLITEFLKQLYKRNAFELNAVFAIIDQRNIAIYNVLMNLGFKEFDFSGRLWTIISDPSLRSYVYKF